jgi:hypothetical protein
MEDDGGSRWQQPKIQELTLFEHDNTVAVALENERSLRGR